MKGTEDVNLEAKARAQAEAAPGGWCLCDRLLGLAHAARLMEMSGWTLEGATLEPAEHRVAQTQNHLSLGSAPC